MAVRFSGSAGRLEPQFAHGDLEVSPGFFFLAGIAQQKCRVIRDYQLGSTEGVDATAQAGEGLALT